MSRNPSPAMPSEAYLTQSLQTLGLLAPSDVSPTSPSIYTSLVCIIAEELDPTFRPSSVSTALEPLLRRFGFTGDATSRLSVLNFLCSTLRSHRILSMRRARSKPPPASRDAALAAAVSLLQAALPHPQRSAPETAPHLAALINSLRLAAEKRLATLGGPEKAMGTLLLDGEAVERRTDKCEKVRGDLVREHRLRKEMLLHRLDVTVQAFARGEKASKAAFEALLERVRREAAEEGDVSLFEVVAAREWALRTERTSEEEGKGVKSVVMGSVPDRGGRVGTGALGAEMPGFKERVAVGRRGGKTGFSRRGKAGKRRRGRA